MRAVFLFSIMLLQFIRSTKFTHYNEQNIKWVNLTNFSIARRHATLFKLLVPRSFASRVRLTFFRCLFVGKAKTLVNTLANLNWPHNSYLEASRVIVSNPSRNYRGGRMLGGGRSTRCHGDASLELVKAYDEPPLLPVDPDCCHAN